MAICGGLLQSQRSAAHNRMKYELGEVGLPAKCRQQDVISVARFRALRIDTTDQSQEPSSGHVVIGKIVSTSLRRRGDLEESSGMKQMKTTSGSRARINSSR
jgi:hypothetical protein